jgi:hypothetical protein
MSRKRYLVLPWRTFWIFLLTLPLILVTALVALFALGVVKVAHVCGVDISQSTLVVILLPDFTLSDSDSGFWGLAGTAAIVLTAVHYACVLGIQRMRTKGIKPSHPEGADKN